MKEFAERELKRLNVDFCLLTAKKLSSDVFTEKDKKKLERITKQRETIKSSLERTKKPEKRSIFDTICTNTIHNIDVKGAKVVK